MHKLTTHFALTIDAYIICFIVASCAIRDLCFVSVVESFTAWHTIQFAWVWCFQIRHPFVSYSFEWRFIKFRTLLMSEIGLILWTILCDKDNWNESHMPPSKNDCLNHSHIPVCCRRNIFYSRLHIVVSHMSCEKTQFTNVIWMRLFLLVSPKSAGATYSTSKHCRSW